MQLLKWYHRYFRWTFGRQKTGYDVMTFLNSQRLKMDLHLIRYRVGASIPPHRDPAGQNKAHYRLNIVLWQAQEGGELRCEHSLFRTHRINLFRPDLALHSVAEVKQGTRYVLSIGWVRRISPH